MAKEKKPSVYQAHDKFFKSSMADPGAKEAFLKTYLPESLKENLNLEKVEEINPQTISKSLQLQESDLLFRVNSSENSANDGIYVLVLMEHKSYSDSRTPFQVLKYLISIWENQLNKKETLKPILPIVFYEGQLKWEYPQLDTYFKDAPAKWRPYLPLYQSLFFDFSLENKLDKLPDNIYLRHYLQVIRSVYEPDKKKLAKELIESFSIIKNEEVLLEIFQRMVLFIDNVHRNDWEESIIDILKGEDIMPITMEQWIEELKEKGRKEGREEGMEKGMEKGMEEGRNVEKQSIAQRMKNMGFTLDDIQKVTGLML